MLVHRLPNTDITPKKYTAKFNTNSTTGEFQLFVTQRPLVSLSKLEDKVPKVQVVELREAGKWEVEIPEWVRKSWCGTVEVKAWGASGGSGAAPQYVTVKSILFKYLFCAKAFRK